MDIGIFSTETRPLYANHHMEVTYDDGMVSIEWQCLHALKIDEYACSLIEGVDAVGDSYFLDSSKDYFDGDEFASGYVYLWWDTSVDWETGYEDGEVLFDYAEQDPDLFVLGDSELTKKDRTGYSLVLMSSAKISAWDDYRLVTDTYMDSHETQRVNQTDSGRVVHKVSSRKDGKTTIRFSIRGKALPSSYILEPGSTVILRRS